MQMVAKNGVLMDRYFVSNEGWLSGYRSAPYDVVGVVINECPYCGCTNFTVNCCNDNDSRDWITDCCSVEVHVQQL